VVNDVFGARDKLTCFEGPRVEVNFTTKSAVQNLHTFWQNDVNTFCIARLDKPVSFTRTLHNQLVETSRVTLWYQRII